MTPGAAHISINMGPEEPTLPPQDAHFAGGSGPAGPYGVPAHHMPVPSQTADFTTAMSATGIAAPELGMSQTLTYAAHSAPHFGAGAALPLGTIHLLGHPGVGGAAMLPPSGLGRMSAVGEEGTWSDAASLEEKRADLVSFLSLIVRSGGFKVREG